MNKSITLLPTSSAQPIRPSVQRILDSVNQLTGTIKSQPAIALSRLETAQAQASLSVPELAERTETNNKTLTAQVKQINKDIEELSLELAELAKLDEFKPAVSADLNDAGWETANGPYHSVFLGSELSNLPAGLTLTPGTSYDVFSTVFSKGAFLQTLHIVGTGTNKVYQRGGGTFASAVTNDWVAL